MDAIQLLTEQHAEVDVLFNQILDTRGVEERRARFARLGDALAVHAAIEEMHFYPAVQAHRTEDIRLEWLEEHVSLKRLLLDLLTVDPTEEIFEPKLTVLKEQFEHHARVEQDDLFPRVRKLLDAGTLEAAGQVMTATRVELEKGRPRYDLLARSVPAGGRIAGGLARLSATFITRARDFVQSRRRPRAA